MRYNKEKIEGVHSLWCSVQFSFKIGSARSTLNEKLRWEALRTCHVAFDQRQAKKRRRKNVSRNNNFPIRFFPPPVDGWTRCALAGGRMSVTDAFRLRRSRGNVLSSSSETAGENIQKKEKCSHHFSLLIRGKGNFRFDGSGRRCGQKRKMFGF